MESLRTCCRRVRTALIVCLMGIGGLNSDSLQAQAVSSTETTINFENDIKPIFEASCIRCHGPDDQAGDFRIDDKDSVLNYLDPGDSSFSDIYDFVSTDDEDVMMPPPDEGGPLDAESIDKIKRWIDEGADWPDTVTLEMPPPEVVEEIEQAIEQAEVEQDKKQGSWQLVWEIVGLLHPVLLHFPVAMLIGGAFFALIGFRGESPLSDAAYYCLWLGAWTGILACVSGWSFAIEKDYLNWQRPFDFNDSIVVHRWGGILVSALAFLLALVASGSRRRDPYGTGAFWKISLILLAVITGFVAHHGGKLTHDGLHDKLLNKSEILIDNISGQSEQERLDKEQRERDEESNLEDDGENGKGAGASDDNAAPDDGDTGDEPANPDEGNAETSSDDGETDDGDDGD